MLALRRAAISSRNRGFRVGALRISYAGLDGSNYGSGNTPVLQQPQQLYSAGVSRPVGHTSFFLAKCLQNGDAKIDDGIYEVQASTQINNTEEHTDGVGDDLVSEAESYSDEESAKENAQELRYAELDTDEKAGLEKTHDFELFKALMNTPKTTSVGSVLDKLVEGGHTFNRLDVSVAMMRLKRLHLYAKALRLSEWAEAKCIDLVEKDYACRLDLIAKVRGLRNAENYSRKIPKEFRTEAMYYTLLANCVAARNLKKAEEVFNKIRDLGLPLVTVVCNQMLSLYKFFDKKKMADVLALMDTENIKPNLATYTVLIDAKGKSNDIKGMEQTIEHMKESGIEPDLYFQAIVARHYISTGYKERAESILREMEGDGIGEESRAACRLLLPLYASLGKEEDVERVWSRCKKEPHIKECKACMEAWGKLGCIDKAEEVFEIMHKAYKNFSASYYNALLEVYTKSSNVTKGKELLKRMSIDGCKIGPTTWDILVKMYLAVGEVEKADSLLCKAVEQSSEKPIFSSYFGILRKYATRGDIDNAEKIFEKMRKTGFIGRIEMYRSLLEAYIVAKVPAYGFRERLKADGVLPGNSITWQLEAVDSYKKTGVVELLY